jgi:hypothetical protein
VAVEVAVEVVVVVVEVVEPVAAVAVVPVWGGVCVGWLNGTPAEEINPEVDVVSPVGVLVLTPMGEPLLSIMLLVIEVMPTLPLLDGKEIVAIGPLPVKERVLMMAILMNPARVVFDTSIAPETRPPWVTVGVDIWSWVRLSSIPATPSISAPCTVYDELPDGTIETVAASEAVDQDAANRIAASRTRCMDDRCMVRSRYVFSGL